MQCIPADISYCLIQINARKIKLLLCYFCSLHPDPDDWLKNQSYILQKHLFSTIGLESEALCASFHEGIDKSPDEECITGIWEQNGLTAMLFKSLSVNGMNSFLLFCNILWYCDNAGKISHVFHSQAREN